MIREVSLATARVLCEHLLAEHYEEVAKFKDVAVLKPDWARYKEAEREGRLLILIICEGNRGIGYSANFLQMNLHYSDLLFAQNDVLYLSPEHRKGALGYRLILETEKRAKERGAKLMLWHTKPQTTLEALMPRLSYEILDTIWARRL